MRVLHVSNSDSRDGASIAAYRLHTAMQELGVESYLFVKNKYTDDVKVISGGNRYINRLRCFLDYLPVKLYPKRMKRLFSVSYLPFSGFRRTLKRIKPDIIHVHWICAGAVSIAEFKNCTIPVVFTLHDNWLYTGGCHVRLSCRQFQNGCGQCPILNSKDRHDLSYILFNRKKKIVASIPRRVIIGVSNWISQDASLSGIIANTKCYTIPNPIDIALFYPMKKSEARYQFCLPLDKKIIVFGAMNPLSDQNKGFLIVKQALELLHMQDRISLLIFGSSEDPEFDGYQVRNVGIVSDQSMLRAVYSAADVMLVPSFQESFGQTASEAMACGTPVVAFNYSGLTDIVDHKINGFLAEPYDVSKFVEGIVWLLFECEYRKISMSARDKICSCFEMSQVAASVNTIYSIL